MRIALIDADGHNFPNLALMKISARHKAKGDSVEWWNGFVHYDRTYVARVFSDEYTQDVRFCINSDEIIKGGTGYNLRNVLPEDVEHMRPDYSLYPKLTANTAYGFLTRGCPRGCEFCVVGEKEGMESRKVADLSEFWNKQREIKLLDPNLTAYPEHGELLHQLIASRASVDFTQGLDIRLLDDHNTGLLMRVRAKRIHFAWDNPSEDLTAQFRRFKEKTGLDYRKLGVYVLTNYNSTHEEDLQRIYALRDMGYSPYVMIYNKPSAPRETRLLQRWTNNRTIFGSVRNFEDYDATKG